MSGMVLPAEPGWRSVWLPHMAAHGLPADAIDEGDLETAPVVCWYVQAERSEPTPYGIAALPGGLTPCELVGTFIGYLAPTDGPEKLGELFNHWREEQKEADTA